VDRESSNCELGHLDWVDDVRRMWECALSRLRNALEAEAGANSCAPILRTIRNSRCNHQFGSSQGK
jgi:hypothetical protein